MKQIVLGALTLALFSCSNNTETTGDEGKSMQTKTESVDNTPGDEGNLGDTTSTMNNSAYNTDSASGQGSPYDSSANR